MRIGYLSLGCKVNAYETEGMKQSLEAAGHQTVPFESEADVYVVNTCTVTNIADRKSRQMLHKARKINNKAIIIAVGCYVQEVGEQLLADGTADIIIGNTNKSEIVSRLESYLKDKSEISDNTDNKTGDIFAVRDYEDILAEGMRENTRAYVKIQDGCNQFCSYCIIPYVRGRIRSRAEESIYNEVSRLAKLGYKEIILTGIHLSSYGLDRNIEGISIENNTELLRLIAILSEISGICRIRLGSLEPRVITETFVEAIAANNKVCPHFHLSLQSGCDDTLKRMNRKYTAKEYYQAVMCLRKYYDKPAITTDVIVGFPGETEEEFDRSRSFVQKIGFYMVHIFKYSVRKGTKAASFDNQINETVKAERSDKLQEVTDELRREYMNSFIGNSTEVLFEESIELDEEKYFVGHNERYVRIAVPCNSSEDYTNCLKKVQIRSFLKRDLLFGEIDD